MARVRHTLTRAGEYRALGDLSRDRTIAQIGRLLERSTRLMQLDRQEFYQAQVTVGDTSKPVYLSMSTTRWLVADSWANIERSLVDANAAFNATADDPHERILALLTALNDAARYADVIYVLTPMTAEPGDA